LYIFFSKYNKFQTKSSALDLLIPHIDHALSKIQHLENLEPVHKPRALINLSALTDRELEVIEWIKAGKTNQEIGVILNITQNTVKSHLKRVYQKLNVGKRAQAVALLVNH
jgi:DNA-binding CsgD family transcriptional regulator